MTNQPDFEEPLHNIDLEAAMMGIRMALSEEEHDEAHAEFMNHFKASQLAVPTANQVQLGPDGQIQNGSDIQLIVAEHPDGMTAIRAFTSLGNLRKTHPELQYGLVLMAWQVAGMVSNSPYDLLLEGPDVNTVVTRESLKEIVDEVQKMAASQQAAVDRNEVLEAALQQLTESGTEETRSGVEQAFLTGFCRIPVWIEADGKVPHLVISTGQGPEAKPQQIPLRTHDGGLLCFTSEDSLSKWNEEERPMMVLPGAAILDMSLKSGLKHVRINEGNPNARILDVNDGRLVVT